MASHPNSLANLEANKGRFTPDNAPKGRKNLGLAVNEWRNVLADYSRADLEAIIADPDAKASQVIAAQEVLQALNGDLNAIEQTCSFSNHKPLTKSENENRNSIERVKRVITPAPSGN